MSTVTTAARPASAATARAVAFVAEHKPAAEALGTSLADHVQDPDAFAAALRDGLATLADPEYLAGQHFIAPGLGPSHGVRWPLLAAVIRGFKGATRQDRPTALLFLADRLFREEHLEARWFAFALLERTLRDDAERTWQLLRRGAREAADWITVDDLAHPYGTGIAAEPYRWAELEQLVFSPSRWERRLVGSTIATMTHGNRRSGRGPEVVEHALPLLGQLIGDDEPDVQKALSWAYRSLAQIDPQRTTERAARGDGACRRHRRRPPCLGHPRQPGEAGSGGCRGATRAAGRDPSPAGCPVDVGGRGPGRSIRWRAGPALPPRTAADLIRSSRP